MVQKRSNRTFLASAFHGTIESSSVQLKTFSTVTSGTNLKSKETKTAQSKTEKRKTHRRSTIKARRQINA